MCFFHHVHGGVEGEMWGYDDDTPQITWVATLFLIDSIFVSLFASGKIQTQFKLFARKNFALFRAFHSVFPILWNQFLRICFVFWILQQIHSVSLLHNSSIKLIGSVCTLVHLELWRHSSAWRLVACSNAIFMCFGVQCTHNLQWASIVISFNFCMYCAYALQLKQQILILTNT